jgi:hypothetical protein
MDSTQRNGPFLYESLHYPNISIKCFNHYFFNLILLAFALH